MLTKLQVEILRKIAPPVPDGVVEAAYEGKSKIGVLLGEEFLKRIQGKTVIDFGCGEGGDAVEMAARGAKSVLGIDIREDVLATARQRARAAGLQEICRFQTTTDHLADIVVSLDAFEHFGDPAAILRIMTSVLQPTGEVQISFGPTWYHPLGGHLFSVFPWAHLIFSEEALIRWRATFKTDGATRFSEVAGGLNSMTIARFEALVAESPLKFASLELVPIRKLQPVHNRLTREWITALVRCRLVKR